MRRFDPNDLHFSEFHRLLLHGIAPRPIAFVSSMDSEGRCNLAPFSFFNAFGVNPPVVCFSPAYNGRTGFSKDTMRNVDATGECTISIVSYEMLHRMNLAAAPYPSGVDEFEKSGLTKLPSERVAPPAVAESPFVMEAKLLHHIAFGGKPGSANMMICEVLLVHVRDDVFGEAGSIDPRKMDQVARMGGSWYSRASAGLFELPQPIGAVIGIDALPEAIRTSSILTGEDLAKLANRADLPDLPAAAQLSSTEQHAIAHELLSAGNVAEAWHALLQ